MGIDNNGIYQYQSSDLVNSWPAFLNLGMSSVSTRFAGVSRNFVYTAGSLSAAETLRTSKGSSAAAPLYVFRTDTKKLMFHNGSVWAEMAPQPEAPTPPKTSMSGRISLGSVAGNGVIEKTITFTNPVVVSRWTPIVTLQGARGSVDRLTATVTGFTSKQLKVAVKNNTSKSATGTKYVNWALIKKGQ